MSFHQDLDNLTRDMHDASWEVEYVEKNPIFNFIKARGNMKFKGGKYYYKEVDTDTQEDLVQDYGTNDTLTHGVKDTTKQVKFKKKYMQCPVQIDIDEEVENAKQTEDGSQLHSLAKFRVQKANEAMRLHIRKKLYLAMSQAKASSDINKYFQGLNNALEVDATYGGVTRTYSAGTKADAGFWFQPMGGTITSAVQATAAAISISWMRTQFEPLEDLEGDNMDLITVLGGVLWLSLQAEAEARSMPYTIEKNRVARQGFKEMILDDRRIVKDPFLCAANNTAMGETTGSAQALERRLYGLNLKDWDLYIHPDRNFKLSEFFDQSKIANGADMLLARVKFAGNLGCWHPNRQLYYENVTP